MHEKNIPCVVCLMQNTRLTMANLWGAIPQTMCPYWRALTIPSGVTTLLYVAVACMNPLAFCGSWLQLALWQIFIPVAARKLLSCTHVLHADSAALRLENNALLYLSHLTYCSQYSNPQILFSCISHRFDVNMSTKFL